MAIIIFGGSATTGSVNSVKSVAGKTGDVVLTQTDITDFPSFKTLNGDQLTGVGDISIASEVSLIGSETLTNKTLKSVIFDGSPVEIDATVLGGTPVIDPADGSIQLWDLTTNSVPTLSFQDGESILLMIKGGLYSIDWSGTGIVWVNSVTPSLAPSGYTLISVWQVRNVIYGSRIGEVA